VQVQCGTCANMVEILFYSATKAVMSYLTCGLLAYVSSVDLYSHHSCSIEI
jgi:hypothetical protein